MGVFAVQDEAEWCPRRGGYQRLSGGGGGGGVGVQPPGLFFFLAVCDAVFVCTAPSSCIHRSTALCMVMQESTARGAEDR